jgi:hypothetical protein
MARWGNCDFSQLKKLQKQMEKLQGTDFCEECAKELAARLLAKVIKRTPVGQYEASSGKVGGTLRRGWTVKTEEEAQSGRNVSAKAYVDSLQVIKTGNAYQIEIINPVHYASYVEYGHRTSNHKGWVAGRFMLTISEQELESQSPAILERKLKKYLGECFNG